MTCSSHLPAALLLAVLLGCNAGPRAGDGPSIALEPCRLSGVSEEVQCGSYEVWEDRATQEGRKITLSIAVIPALASPPEPDPLFILAGGPGQAATEVGPRLLPILKKILSKRDIVLVDQRGTGKSNRLACPPDDGRDEESDRRHRGASSTLEDLFASRFDPDLLRDCLEQLDADVTLYTTPIAMDDLDEIRQGLGYETINLYGGSYGTRAALVYMRRHPETVRVAILDGVAPQSIKLPLYMARDAQRAMELLLQACEESESCRAAFPEIGATFASMLDRLARAPARVQAHHPRTGEPAAVEISRDAFAGSIRGALYDPEVSSLLPLILTSASDGDFGPFVALSQTLADGLVDSISIGMFLSVVCAEDIPQIRPEEREPALAGTFLGAVMLDSIREACDIWPAGDLPPEYYEPVRSDRPVMILSGDLDPATPPRWGEEAAQHLTNSVHLIAPGSAHNVLPRGCVPDLVADFVGAGSLEGIDATCVETIRRPPFFIDPAGPTP